MKKIFKEDLCLKSNNMVDWKNSVGREVRLVYGRKNGTIIITSWYRNGKEYYLDLIYNNKKYSISTKNFLYAKLNNIVNLSENVYKYRIGDVVNNLLITGAFNGKNNKKSYKVKCIKDGYDFEILEYALVNGAGCSVCSNKKIIKGVNDMATTHPHLVKYLVNVNDAYNYSYGSSKKVLVRCIDCGNKRLVSIDKLVSRNTISCSCRDGVSYPEKIMYSTLKQLNLEFETEYSPDWIRPKRYDFYIPSKNLIIEMDGGLGHGHKSHGKSTVTPEESLAIDIVKDEQALINGIKVVRINSEKSDVEYIKNNIYNSELSFILAIENIDWCKCEEFALSNMAKDACILWESKKYTTVELADAMCVSKATIIRWLKRGSRARWCNYNLNTQKLKGCKAMNKSNKKRLICDGIVFESISECAKYHSVANSTITNWLKSSKHKEIYLL